MIRRHGSPRRHAGGAVSASLPLDGWGGRLALLVVALGLVLMHHVVGAHQHSAPDVAPSAASAQPVVDHAPPSPAEHRHGGDLEPTAGLDEHRTVPVLPAPSSAALLHHHPGEGGHDHAGSLLHLCLAALVGAAVVLLVLVLVARWWRPPSPRGGTAGGAPVTAPRAPPASSRQAELQVLRL